MSNNDLPQEIKTSPIRNAFLRVFAGMSIEDYNKRVQDLNAKLKNVEDKRKELEDWQTDLYAKRDKIDEERAKIHNEKQELELARRELEAQKRQAQQLIDTYREKEAVSPTVSDKSLNRDQILLEEVNRIKQSVKDLQEKVNGLAGNRVTLEQYKGILKEKAELLAESMAVLALYNDLLPEKEEMDVSIEKQSIPTYLNNHMRDLLKLSKAYSDNSITIETDVGMVAIDESLYCLLGNTYERIARDKLSVWADKAYDTAGYYPFEGGFTNFDKRGIRKVLFNGICSSKTKYTKLQNKACVGTTGYGGYILSKEASQGFSGAPRSTIDSSKETPVETGIANTFKEIEDIGNER